MTRLEEIGLRIQSGDLEGSLALIDEAIRVTNMPELHQAKITLLIQAGKLKEATAALGLLLVLHPKYDRNNETLTVIRRMVGTEPLENQVPKICPLPHLRAQEFLTDKVEHGWGHQMDTMTPTDPSPHWKRHLWILKNMRLLGEHGVPVAPDGTIITDSFLNEDIVQEGEKIEKNGFLSDDPPTLKGSYMALYGKWAEGFWHWITENIPMIILAEQHGFNGIYLIPPNAPFIHESMYLLGIDPNRVVEATRGNLRVEMLYMPQRIMGGHLICYPGLLMELRKRLLKNIKLEPGKAADERIYISRNKSTRPRKVVNEEALLQIIEPFNFKMVHMEGLTLTEQLQLASQARVLIGPHGAGMLHSLFMPPESTVIEFFSPLYVNATLLPGLKHLKHYYFMLPSYVFTDHYGHGQNIHICPDLVTITLSRMLS